MGALVKKEIVTQKISASCCRRAFLCAVCRGSGTFYIKSADYGVIVQGADHELIQKCVAIVKSITGAEPEVNLHSYSNKLGPDEVFEFNLKHSDGVYDKLVEAGILPPPSVPDALCPPYVIEKSCCKISYLMGAFVSCGTLSAPREDSDGKSSGYYMGFKFSSEAQAKFMADLLNGYNANAKIRKRGESYSAYIKDAEKISDMLTRMHAVSGMLELQNIMLYRLLKNNSNRYSNCEAANISKTVNAAVKQLEAIDKLKRAGILDSLDASLQDVAAARLNNPDATLSELTEIIPGHPNRGAVNHRLKRLLDLSEAVKD